jgi:hypothetical protein
MKVRTKTIGISIGLALLISAALFLWHIDRPRVVARAIAPDGTEFCVIQTFNWHAELFTTSCYYRKPGGQWGWFYYDHQDWYWGRGRAELDLENTRISIYRGGRLTVTFDWVSETFQLLRPDVPHREIAGALKWMPIGWDIAQK